MQLRLGPNFVSQRPAPGGQKVNYIEGWRLVMFVLVNHSFYLYIGCKKRTSYAQLFFAVHTFKDDHGKRIFIRFSDHTSKLGKVVFEKC